jgi:hypothetical protein
MHDSDEVSREAIDRQVEMIQSAGIRPIYPTEEAEREAREEAAFVQLHADAIVDAGRR